MPASVGHGVTETTKTGCLSAKQSETWTPPRSGVSLTDEAEMSQMRVWKTGRKNLAFPHALVDSSPSRCFGGTCGLCKLLTVHDNKDQTLFPPGDSRVSMDQFTGTAGAHETSELLPYR